MSNIFLAADHHLGHRNILTFTRDDGSPLRNFANITEHDEYIIYRHNSVVRPKDKVYFLGDVVMSHTYLCLLGRMNGEKILIKGNHDTAKLSQYVPYFADIRGFHQLSGFALSHIPIHPDSLGRWGVNVHGHTHARKVMLTPHQPDTRYFCVSMEALNDYTPISLEQIKQNYDK